MPTAVLLCPAHWQSSCIKHMTCQDQGPARVCLSAELFRVKTELAPLPHLPSRPPAPKPATAQRSRGACSFLQVQVAMCSAADVGTAHGHIVSSSRRMSGRGQQTKGSHGVCCFVSTSRARKTWAHGHQCFPQRKAEATHWHERPSTASTSYLPAGSDPTGCS